MGEGNARRPGRPREESIDRRLIDAALALIDTGEPVTAARLVERSGVSRAAIYRRWGSLTDLVAAALDEGRAGPVIQADSDLRTALVESFLGLPERDRGEYPEERLRRRIILGLEDRTLQRRYWDAHVVRRRDTTIAALRAGVERGEIRDALNLEACADLLSGVLYYQFVVRGESLTDPAVLERCRHAFDVVWRGMQAMPGPDRAP